MSDTNPPLSSKWCGACGTAVDPLRAARVAVFGERFHYFCSPACCERFVPSAPPVAAVASSAIAPSAIPPCAVVSAASLSRPPPPAVPSAGALLAPPERSELEPSPAPPAESAQGHSPQSRRAPPSPAPVKAADHSAASSAPAAPLAPSAPLRSAAPTSAAATSAATPAALPSRSEPAAARKAARCAELHAGAALGLGALGVDLFWSAGAPVWLAPWTAAAAFALLTWGTWRREELVWRGPALLGLLAPLTATLAALGSLLVDGRAAAHSASVAGAVCFAAAASLGLVTRERQAFAPLHRRLEQALQGGGAGKPALTALAGELRPGEEFLLAPGERSPADAVIVAGRAQVEPWFESPLRVARQEGDTLLAGARVVDGALRSVVRWAGMDRAWARLTLDPDRRADRHARPARLAERLSTSGALLLALLGALLAFSSEPGAALVFCSAAALASTLASIALPELVALQLSSGVHQLLARGISFRGPAALDQAARTSAVVFCAEGTLLADEPSVASIEPAGKLAKNDLLALLAGAFAGVASPLALALQRCAQAYQVRPDATRSPSHVPGLGVTAVASTGQSLVVGTRALLLGRRISVAGAEKRVAELEALGRSVLLAALDGRYVGLLALQDGIAAGGRAAVQYLIDAEVEAILLSGEARDTCNALAHHLGIDHVRPEVAPEDRASELRRLADSTPDLAVVGRASKDDAVLGAVPLSINIEGAGGALERWDIDVASGDARDAAWAVHLARKLYADTTRSIVAASAPALVALLASLLGLPAWLAPLAGVAGSALLIQRLKRRSRRPIVASAIRQRAPAASS